MNLRLVLTLLVLAVGAPPLSAQASSSEPGAPGAVLTLEDARDAARDAAFGNRTASARVSQAQELEAQARSLWMPTVDASAAYVYDTRRQEFDPGDFYAPLSPWLDAVSATTPGLPSSDALLGGVDPVELRPQHIVQGELTLTQTLYQPRVAPLLRQARASGAQAEAMAAVAALAVDRAVVELYFEAVRLQRLEEVAARAVALASVQVERAQAALDAEVGTSFALQRAEVARLRAIRDRDAAANGAAIARDALAELLDRAPGFAVAAPSAVAPPATLADAIELAESRRPELEAARRSGEVAAAAGADVRAGGLPVVQASVTGRAERQTDLVDDRLSATVTVGARWSLWDGGQRRAQRRFRAWDETVATIQVDEARAAVAGDVRRAWLAWEQAGRDLELAEQELALAARNVEVTEAAWQSGAASALDVDAAREQRRAADASVVEARTARDASLHLLRLATGG